MTDRYREQARSHIFEAHRSLKAAEKRQAAEASCRFSGIAALAAARKAPVYGLFENGTALALSITRTFWSPKGFRHEHQLR
jgi:hypothetical protein